MIAERPAQTASGYFMLFLTLAAGIGGMILFISAAVHDHGTQAVIWALLMAAGWLCFGGLFTVNPNEGRVVQIFGTYIGTARKPGLQWVSPFCTRRRVSLRVRNFESGKLKVNDRDGNPIEIAAVVVWKVVDTAEAIFEVDSYEHFVQVQSEAALRNLATTHPYDSHVEGETALRSQAGEVAEQLKVEIQARLTKAGVEVIESRISHLAYAPEIAGAMLQRQQASAIIAARQKIVEGAVSMVEMALDQLAQRRVVELDTERRAAMVSNLLVVLCSDRHTQPVINTGTLYQ